MTYYLSSRRSHLGRDIAIVCAVVALFVVIAVAVLASCGGSLGPSAWQTQSYDTGHDVIGPAALTQVQDLAVPAARACDNLMQGWMIHWDTGVDINHMGLPLDVPHGDAPSWWDHDGVMRGCVDYVHGVEPGA